MTEHDAAGGEAPLDAAEALAIIGAQRRRTEETVPSGALLFGVWGVTWLVGYGALWASADADGNPSAPAAVVAVVLGVAAIATTIVHVVRRTRGITGGSAVEGAMYGWAWFVGFAAQGAITAAVGRAGASAEVTGLVANAVAALVVGLLYIAGGVLWRSVAMYALGAWMALVGAASAFAGLPGSYLWLSVAGGGGMLVAALASRLGTRRGGDRA